MTWTNEESETEPCDPKIQFYSTSSKTKWDNDIKLRWHHTQVVLLLPADESQEVVWLAEQFYDVIIRGAMLIDINSWKRSLQAYGIRTREIWPRPQTKRKRQTVSRKNTRLTTCWDGYWSGVPVSCCGSLDTRTCASVCWRWPSVHTDYTRGLDTDQTPRTDALWETEPPRERFDNHAPSPRTAGRHHWDRQVRDRQRVRHRQVTQRQTGDTDWFRMSHRDLPSIGCLLRIWTGPRALEWILSSTMCLRRW